MAAPRRPSDDDLRAQVEAAYRMNQLRTRDRLEALHQITGVVEEIQGAQEKLRELVGWARMSDASWSEIARALGVTPQAAQRRFDRGAREKRLEYQRKRASGGSA